MSDVNIALMIDADNLAAKYIESILNELTKYGKVNIRRMYGDWSKPSLKSWLEQASKYSLTPIMQENNTKGKNASDICLVIDAMDILYEKKAECFCIASSDSDFNKLAKRLRESGNMVIGMGEEKTPESFRASCERFVFLNVLQDDDEAGDSEEKTDDELTGPVTAPKKRNGKKKEVQVFTPKETIENAIVKMVSDNSTNGKATNLAEVGNRLVKIFPDFDVRNYGYSNLSSYLEDFQSLQIETKDSTKEVLLNVSDIVNIESQIQLIYRNQNVTEMNTGELKNHLDKAIPNLDASIRSSGFSKFSSFLDKKISCIHMKGKRNNVAALVEKPLDN